MNRVLWVVSVALALTAASAALAADFAPRATPAVWRVSPTSGEIWMCSQTPFLAGASDSDCDLAGFDWVAAEPLVVEPAHCPAAGCSDTSQVLVSFMIPPPPVVDCIRSSLTVTVADSAGHTAEISWVVHIVYPPPMPTITPNPACVGTNVTVSWSPVSGATSYRLYRDGSQIWTGSGTSTSVSAVAGSYWVTAYTPCGWIASPSRTLTVITVPPTPGTPTITPNPACAGMLVTVSWSSVPGATSYCLYVNGSEIWCGSGTSYQLLPPPSIGNYIYTLSAGNDCGWSSQSSGRTLVVNDVPPTPGTPTITPNPACAGTMVTVSWSPVSGATSYRLYRDGSQIWTGSGTSTSVSAVAGSYTVSAGNDCGWSSVNVGVTLTVVGQPTIGSLEPDYGAPGTDEIVIIGYDFMDDPGPGFNVEFAGGVVVAHDDTLCHQWTNTRIELTVPPGAQTGLVYVNACGQSDPYDHWTPVGLVLVAATATSPDEIHLEWYGEGGSGSSYDIFRAEGGYSREYELVATVVPEGDGIQVYVDTDVEPSQTYCYMVSPSGSGLSSASGPLCAETPEFRPESYALLGAAPNPFNPSTTVFFDVPDPGGRVELVLYDISGRKVATLCDGQRDPGRNSVYWGGMMDSGESAASGVYLCRMVAEGFETSCKITMLK